MTLLEELFPLGLPAADSEAAYMPGPEARFAELLTWSDMENILSRSCFDGRGSTAIAEALELPSAPSRVCLLRDGREIWRVPRRIDASDFRRRLADATLRIEAVEEVHAPLRDLADELQRQAPTCYINAYAAWGRTRGLALHYDYTCILVMQITGCKAWKVYRPTRAAQRGPESSRYKESLQRAERGETDNMTELDRVRAGLVWEGELSAGDALFLPPGWFHGATPVGQSTLHISCAFHAPSPRIRTGIKVRMPDELRGE